MKDDIIVTINRIFDDNLDPSIKVLERIWFRNILYYLGEQYIEWQISRNTFRRKKHDQNTPTPVSNIIKSYVKSMKALILNEEYRARIWPNSSDQKDKEAAMMGEILLNNMDEKNDGEFFDEQDKVVTWMILTGIGFNRSYPDMEKGSGKDFKSGEIISSNVIPFNVRVDGLGDNLRAKRWTAIKTLMPKELIEDTYHVKAKNTGDGEIISYQKRLMKLVANVSPWKSSGIETSLFNARDEDLVLFKEVEFKPNKEFPDGRYVSMIGDDQKLLDLPRLPIETKDGLWNYTLTDFHYDYVPGRFWSDPGVNDQISPQDSINSIDQALEMNRKGVGRPIVMLGTDMNISRVSKYGQPLLVLRYDSLLSGGQPPIIEQGKPLPQQVLYERDIHKETSQDAGSDPKNVLRGKPASSRSSGVQVDILQDTAKQAHAPDSKRYYRALRRVYRKRLILAQEVYTEARLLKIAGRGEDIRIISFKGSQLRNNTDVRVETTKDIASTQAGRTQLLIQMQQGGFFGDLTQDPDTQHELFKRLGLGSIKHKTGIDVDRAEWENSKILNNDLEDVFIAMGEEGMEIDEYQVISPDPLFKYDDHFVHYEVHRKFVLSAEFRSLPQLTQETLITHLDVHNVLKQRLIQQMQEQAAEQEGKKTP